MSTVDLKTAEKVIAGDFPEDDVTAIIRYENCFNGNFAYKLIFKCQDTPAYRNYLLHQYYNLIAAEIYWEAAK